MIIPTSAIASVLNAMRAYSRKVDRAAESVATAGIDVKPADPRPGEAPTQPVVSVAPKVTQDSDLAESMTTIVSAQRAFMDQQRVLEAARMMMGEEANLKPGNPRR
jgi:hypothetical protein